MMLSLTDHQDSSPVSLHSPKRSSLKSSQQRFFLGFN